MHNDAPRWDLSNVYPGLDSAEYAAAVADLGRQIDALTAHLTDAAALPLSTPVATLAGHLAEAIDRFNAIGVLAGTVGPYVRAFVTTDSRDLAARRKLSEQDPVMVRLRHADTLFRTWIGTLAPTLEALIAAHPTVHDHAFGLRETVEQSRYLMSPAEESLAAELAVSGANAWGKLQGTITSQLSGEVTVDGTARRLPLPAIINLHAHPDRAVRRAAHATEIALLAGARESLAACMNGVKGTVVTLNKRRGRQDALHSAVDAARIDRPTLEAMLGAIEDALPHFRRYFNAKAKRLGLDRLAWWDIWAPTGSAGQTYTFAEAEAFIVQNFGTFSAELAAFAARAFANRWIDAEMRDGKRGGAFCMGVAGVAESRILCNFDGSLDQISTIAHELGHAYHNEQLFAAGKPPLRQRTPMTLAETASIMCETIVMERVLAQTTDPQVELGILETMLVGDTQVIVDIFSRFLFEREVFERREAAELSADDLCTAMNAAQRHVFGDAVDPETLHPYMWAWKPHYYRAGLSFYNFPYAFGLLFGIGLYAIYQQRGADFVADYNQLLADTGEGNAADLAARFGIDIRDRAFWEASLGVIGARIDRYCAI